MQRGTCWFRPRFSFVGLKFLTPACFDYISIFTLFGRCKLSLTVLLHVLSMSRSLSPEGNYRLCFSLFVQGLHTACSIWTINGKKEKKKDIESNNVNVKQNKTDTMQIRFGFPGLVMVLVQRQIQQGKKRMVRSRLQTAHLLQLEKFFHLELD